MTSEFHNLTVGTTVDRFGALKAQLTNLKADDEALRGELIARNVEAAEGHLFRGTVSEALRQSLDTEQVKSEMGERWCASHCNIAVTTTVHPRWTIICMRRVSYELRLAPQPR